jgi:hypothetical protein
VPAARLARLLRQPYALHIGVCILIALHVGATLLLWSIKDSTGFLFPSALAMSEVGLLSWWVALGSSNIVLALSGWLAAMTALLTLDFAFCSRLLGVREAWDLFEWAAVLYDCPVVAVFSAPALVLCLFAAGTLRRRTRRTNDSVCPQDITGSARPSVRRSQFSVRDGLQFLTVVAGSLSTALTLQPYPGWITDGFRAMGELVHYWIWPLLLGGCLIEMLLTTSAARWLVLGRCRFVTRFGAFVALILLSALVCRLVNAATMSLFVDGRISITRDFEVSAFLHPLSEVATVAAMSVASFLILRLSGCQTAADKSISEPLDVTWS